MCRDIIVDGVTFEDGSERVLRFSGCFNSIVMNSKFSEFLREGFASAIAVADGTKGLLVTQCNGRDMRHLVATGGDTLTNRDIIVERNTGSFFDAAADSHAETIGYTVRFNIFRQILGNSESDVLVTCQGANFQVYGNELHGARSASISVEPRMNPDALIDGANQVSVRDNWCYDSGGSGAVVRNNNAFADDNGLIPNAPVIASTGENRLIRCGTRGIVFQANGGDILHAESVGDKIIDCKGGASDAGVYALTNLSLIHI